MPCADMAVGNSLPTPLLLGVDALAGIVSLRGLVREVAVNPTNPTVLFNFAATLERLGEKDHLAAVVYMRALDFETEGSKDWAECIAAIFSKLIQPQCDGVAKPAWWNDEALLSLSQRVLDSSQQSPAACVMRADVLAGPSQNEWAAAEARTADQLAIAARLYLSVAEANERQGQPPQQVAMLRQLATSCMERAQEEQGPGSKPTSFWAAHSVGRPAPWQAT